MTSWLLTFPISALIKKLAGGAITSNLAVLNILNAIILIFISVLLTLIAGYIPSKIAAKKTPLKRLEPSDLTKKENFGKYNFSRYKRQ